MLQLPLLLSFALAGEPFAPPEYAPTTLHYGQLSVVIDELPEADTVGLVIQFSEGSNQDGDGAREITHLVEHLFFRGKTSTGGSLLAQAKASHCDFSGSTGGNTMTVGLACPRSETDWATEEAFRWVTDPLRGVTSAEVALETSIVAQENLEREGSFAPSMREIYSRVLPEWEVPTALMQTAPRPVKLSEAQARVRELRKSPYVLSISGPIDGKALQKRFTEALGATTDVTYPEEIVGSTDLPKPVKNDLDPVPLDQAYPSATVAYAVPSDGTDYGLLAREMQSLLYFELISKPIQEELVDREGGSKASWVVCSHSSLPEVSLLVCEIGAEDEKKARALAYSARQKLSEGKWEDTVEKMRATEPSSPLYAGYRSKGSPVLRANLGVMALFDGRIPSEAYLKERPPASQISVSDVQSMLAVRRASLILFTPASAKGISLGRAPKPSRSRSQVKLEGGSSLPQDLPTVSFQLDNGLSVTLVEEAGVPFPLATLLMSYEGMDPYGLLKKTLDLSLWPEGLAAKGLIVDEGVSRTTIRIVARPILKNLTYLFKQMSKWVRDPEVLELSGNYGQVALALIRHSALAVDEAKDWRGQSAMSRVVELLLPNPFGGDRTGSEMAEAIEAIDSSLLTGWIRSMMRPSRSHLVITLPDLSTAGEVKTAVEKTLGKWKTVGRDPLMSRAPHPIARSPEVLQEDTIPRRDSWGEVAWGCRLPDDSDSAVVGALNDIIEARVWTELRERRGLVYSPQVDSVWIRSGESAIFVNVQTSVDRVKPVRAVLKDLFREFTITEEEVAWAQRGWSLSRVDKPLARSWGMEDIVMSEVNPLEGPQDVLTALQSTHDGINTAAVRKMASSCLSHQALVVTEAESQRVAKGDSSEEKREQ